MDPSMLHMLCCESCGEYRHTEMTPVPGWQLFVELKCHNCYEPPNVQQQWYACSTCRLKAAAGSGKFRYEKWSQCVRHHRDVHARERNQDGTQLAKRLRFNNHNTTQKQESSPQHAAVADTMSGASEHFNQNIENSTIDTVPAAADAANEYAAVHANNDASSITGNGETSPVPSDDQEHNASMQSCDNDISTDQHRTIQLKFDRDSSKTFFGAYQYGFTGPEVLVQRSLSRSNHPGRLPDSHVQHHLQLSDFCYGLGRHQQGQLATILRGIQDISQEYDNGNNASSPQRTPIDLLVLPHTLSDVRRMYSAEGRWAIANNLPHPDVAKLTHHAYVSIRQSIADCLAHGILPTNEYLQSPSTIIHNPVTSNAIKDVADTQLYKEMCCRARALYPGETIVVLWLAEWSDDFEPNTLKTNRGSVWLKTVTIGRPRGTANAVRFTYPVAVGQKGVNHEEVEKRFADELMALRTFSDNNLHFDGRTREMVRVYAELFVSLQDQPERRGSCHLLAGNSRYHARWGWSCDFLSITDVFRACSNCTLRRFDHHRGGCNDCLDWSLDAQSASKLASFSPPPNFPLDIRPRQRLPIALTFPLLIGAVELARNKVDGGDWSVQEGQAYLQLHCIKEEMSHHLIDGAAMRSRLRFCKKRLVQQPADYEATAMIEALDSEPDLLSDRPLPSVWSRGIDFSQHIDVPMHLLFLGIMKTVVHTVNEWTSSKNANAAFMRYAEKALDRIPQLDWCRLIAYTGKKLGGWLSENYLAFARVSVWFYRRLSDVVADEAVYAEPVSPVTKWTKSECNSWFANRGITVGAVVERNKQNNDTQLTSALEKLQTSSKAISTMPVAVARKIISLYLSEPTTVPSLVATRVCNGQVIGKLVNSCHKMMCLIMAEEIDNALLSSTDTAIKDFLDCYSTVETSLRNMKNTEKKNEKPRWVSHYNFVSLLNMPAIMEKFGPVRNYWEGSSLGEGYIRILKSEINNGLREGWQKPLLLRILKKRAFDIINSKTNLSFDTNPPDGTVPGDDEQHRDDEGSDKHPLCGKVRTYKDLVEINTLFSHRHAISCYYSDSSYFVNLQGNLRLMLQILGDSSTPRSDSVYHHGCWYFPFRRTQQLAPDHCPPTWFTSTDAVPALLLPMHDDEDAVSQDSVGEMYTAVFSDWQVMGESGRPACARHI